jgi:hypothetical protein
MISVVSHFKYTSERIDDQNSFEYYRFLKYFSKQSRYKIKTTLKKTRPTKLKNQAHNQSSVLEMLLL